MRTKTDHLIHLLMLTPSISIGVLIDTAYVGLAIAEYSLRRLLESGFVKANSEDGRTVYRAVPDVR